ncbi:hypothetical protein GMO_26340 [Gluconobacter morbifer G707]|uniref:Uncharacterized protein n=2 Tax=Gluconobacter TaxID=441 RepID=G6XMB6_9PROT|nr:hypothetical protein GMO_26340 [Gluconobacter morbifer G707]
MDGGEDSDLFPERFEIDSNRYQACDAAFVRFAVRPVADVTERRWFEESCPTRKWLVVQMRDREAEETDWQILFEGFVDHLQYSPEQGFLDVECRDALAALMDLRVRDGWLNHTVSDLLLVMAGAAGLSADISLPDDQASWMSGQFWQVEYRRSALLSQHRFQTAADLAFTLASWDSRQRSGTHAYYDGVHFSQDAPAEGGCSFLSCSGAAAGRSQAVGQGKI